jgi:multisubunit Na+/H+ antiporter MnhB subunit
VTTTTTDPHDDLRAIRRWLTALVALGAAGLTAELVALGHYEDGWQMAPLGLLVASLATLIWFAWTGSAASVSALRAIMALVVSAGVLGIALHYQGNLEFQLEIDASQSHWDLFTKVLHAKAPPALAPGAMAQLGLLGLVVTARHPARRARP